MLFADDARAQALAASLRVDLYDAAACRAYLHSMAWAVDRMSDSLLSEIIEQAAVYRRSLPEMIRATRREQTMRRAA